MRFNALQLKVFVAEADVETNTYLGIDIVRRDCGMGKQHLCILVHNVGLALCEGGEVVHNGDRRVEPRSRPMWGVEGQARPRDVQSRAILQWSSVLINKTLSCTLNHPVPIHHVSSLLKASPRPPCEAVQVSPARELHAAEPNTLSTSNRLLV